MELVNCQELRTNTGTVERITCTVVAVELITSQGAIRLMGRNRVELTNNPEVRVELMTC